jgi:hypothetical protein
MDLHSGISWSFGYQGEGPGELRNAYSVQFLGDTLISVISSVHLEEFTTEGEWIDRTRLPDLGVRAVAHTWACSERWFFYGKPSERLRKDSTQWVHETADLGTSVTPRLSLPGTAPLRFGALYGFAGTDEGVAVWHDQNGVGVGYWVPCEGKASVVDHRGVEETVSTSLSAAGDRAMVTVLPDTLFWGAVAEGTSFIHAFQWEDGDEEITTIKVLDDTDCSSAELGGSWRIYDLSQGKLLLAQHDPFPAVKIVEWAWLRSLLTTGSCVPGN